MQDPYLDTEASYNRLLTDYMKYGSLVIGVDFDGTFHDYHKEGHTYFKVEQLIRDLKSINCKIIVWTAYQDLDYVKDYMVAYNIPYDGVNTDGIPLNYYSRKPFFSALLDDRAGLAQVYGELRRLVDHVLLVKSIHNK